MSASDKPPNFKISADWQMVFDGYRWWPVSQVPPGTIAENGRWEWTGLEWVRTETAKIETERGGSPAVPHNAGPSGSAATNEDPNLPIPPTRKSLAAPRWSADIPPGWKWPLLAFGIVVLLVLAASGIRGLTTAKPMAASSPTPVASGGSEPATQSPQPIPNFTSAQEAALYFIGKGIPCRMDTVPTTTHAICRVPGLSSYEGSYAVNIHPSEEQARKFVSENQKGLAVLQDNLGGCTLVISNALISVSSPRLQGICSKFESAFAAQGVTNLVP